MTVVTMLTFIMKRMCIRMMMMMTMMKLCAGGWKYALFFLFVRAESMPSSFFLLTCLVFFCGVVFESSHSFRISSRPLFRILVLGSGPSFGICLWVSNLALVSESSFRIKAWFSNLAPVFESGLVFYLALVFESGPGFRMWP